MANFHCTAKMVSRQGGKSCVAALAYRTGTKLVDAATGLFWDYTLKEDVAHVEILIPSNAPPSLRAMAKECLSHRQSAIQKFSHMLESYERRKDSQAYREVEFSLPNELTYEQNVEWAKTFVEEVFVARGMVAVVSFHYDRECPMGEGAPHCHVLLSTRHLAEEGFGLKNRDWNRKDFLAETREQCCQYQNAALAKHGHDVRVTHLSYADREVGIDPQTKLGSNVREMILDGVPSYRQKVFDGVRLKNQFKVLKDPEIVFQIVTSQHATFTRKDLAKVLNRYIDDTDQFRILLDRLMASKELVELRPKNQQEGKPEDRETGTQASPKPHESFGATDPKDRIKNLIPKGKSSNLNKDSSKGPGETEASLGQAVVPSEEAVYTTRTMVKAEISLIQTAEKFAARKTHAVPDQVTNAVIAAYHKRFWKEGGLSQDQERAIRHMLSGEQISCVVGYAGAGKTTCVEAAHQAWRDAGYAVLGLAPTGKAQKGLEACGLRAMTVHRFLLSHHHGREQISSRTVIVLDEASMMDGRRSSELMSIVEKAGAKIVPLGDNNQLQAVGPDAPFRLITGRVPPVVLETIVRQKVDWQREASRLLGSGYPRKALKLYEGNGCFTGVSEIKPDLLDAVKMVDNYSLARQVSGRIWKEMEADVKAFAKREKDKGQSEGEGKHDKESGKEEGGTSGNGPDLGMVRRHPDYATYKYWKRVRDGCVQNIITGFEDYKEDLGSRGVDTAAFEGSIRLYKAASQGEDRGAALEKIEGALRKMSYQHPTDTRVQARKALVEAWAADRQAFPKGSHLMLAFTIPDVAKLNEAARTLMRQQGVIEGPEITYATQTIEEDDFGVESRVTHNRPFARGDKILFTRNDKGMGTSNGALGTIISLDPHKVTVLLDKGGAGESQRTLSFAPKLYPFFDYGWATTVRKAQSVTVDHVKFLASWQDYRNLAYVALTRHRHSFKLFFSDLDFWRSQKLVDRLSRIQEKLSALDYGDMDKLHAQIQEDTDILWRHWHLHKMEAGIQRGKDLWTAVKITARDLFEVYFPSQRKPSQGAGPARKALVEEAYLSLEDSEEMRSQAFFPDLEEGERGFGDFSFQAPIARGGKGRKGENLSPSGLPVEEVHRLKNRSKILTDPEIVLEVATARHSTFTHRDIAKILNDHIDDQKIFEILSDRLAQSPELVNLGSAPGQPEPNPLDTVFTTRTMLRIEQGLKDQAKAFHARKTHPVPSAIIEKVIAQFHKEYEAHGGLSPDQEQAVRHMLSPTQLSSVVGFAGTGKTTCLRAADQAWREAGYVTLGIAPTGKAAQGLQAGGIPSLTIHKFLKAQKEGTLPLNSQSIIVMDEAGMVGSRRFGEVFSCIEAAGAKIVPTGDNYQVQSIEAGPAYRLVCQAVAPVRLETVVRQRMAWQRDASRLFGQGHPRQALELYQKQGAFKTVTEPLPDFSHPDSFVESFCLARQLSGRIFKEILEDYKAVHGKEADLGEEGTFNKLSEHCDYDLWATWRERRREAVGNIIQDYGSQKTKLEGLGVDVQNLEEWINAYFEARSPEDKEPSFEKIEGILRKMSYGNIFDTRQDTKKVMGAEWAADWEAAPDRSHLMLAFTNRDTQALNDSARQLMREKGKIIGPDYTFETKSIEEDDFKNMKVVSGTRSFAQGDRILFTLNNDNLHVRNGSLGTIVSLDAQTITVLLDDPGSQHPGKTEDGTSPGMSPTSPPGASPGALVFSPRDYPFIDNGWATNIHKSQSVTAGDVKLLGSYEQFRNLAYVGMTRHWHTLKVYVSDLDFWREEKVGDRLSRVQEKLSGFDYLDEETIRDLLSQEKENAVLEGRPTNHQEGRGLGDALKEGAGWLTEQDPLKEANVASQNPPLPGSPVGPTRSGLAPRTDFLDEPYLHLEKTEEKRSSDIFKNPGDAQGKGVFAGKKQDGKASRQKSEKEKEKEREREKETPPQQQGHPSPKPSPQPSPKLSQREGPSPMKEGVDGVPKVGKDKPFQPGVTQTVIRERTLSFQEVDEKLRERVVDLATGILGKPTGRTGNTLRFGRKGSVCVMVNGPKTGVFTNFEKDGKGRGPLRFIEDHMGLSATDARKWAMDWLGEGATVIQQRITPKAAPRPVQAEDIWKPITPIPSDAPPSAIEKRIQWRLKEGGKCTGIHPYRNEEGRLMGYVARLEKPLLPKPEGNTLSEAGKEAKTFKETIPFSYGEDGQGKRYWRWKGFFGKDNRTPYGIEKLKEDHGKPVGKPILVVEGEKTADAAQKLLPDYHVVTWIGGAGAVEKTAWSCLVGKTVAIWPDYDIDQGGQKAGEKLRALVAHLNRAAGKEGCVGVVELPDNLREAPYCLKDGWDLADPLPEGWTVETVRDKLKVALGGLEKGQDREAGEAHKKPGITKGSSVPEEGTGNDPDAASWQEAKAPEKVASPIQPRAPQTPLSRKRAAFEQSRLSVNQEWCATLGYIMGHKRLPHTTEELGMAYWQGERLTAIEGRLYQEGLATKKPIDEKKLVLQARAELAKNQKIPKAVLTFGKASEMTAQQLKQLEQHALMHQDKTGGLPTLNDLEAIGVAIKTHGKWQGGEREEGRGQPAARGRATNEIAPSSSSSPQPKANTAPSPSQNRGSNIFSPYTALVEQQAILARLVTKEGERALGKESPIPLKEPKPSYILPNSQEVQASCSERLQRLNQKIQESTAVRQEMKALERSRQNQRGRDV